MNPFASFALFAFFAVNSMVGSMFVPQGGAVPKFVIERELPGAGKLTAEQIQQISQKSCNVIEQLGPQVQWVQSYVTDDKIYCVYIAANEEIVREHARRGGFPANKISQVRRVIDPTTSEIAAV